jgi:hypothetical protein
MLTGRLEFLQAYGKMADVTMIESNLFNYEWKCEKREKLNMDSTNGCVSWINGNSLIKHVFQIM